METHHQLVRLSPDNLLANLTQLWKLVILSVLLQNYFIAAKNTYISDIFLYFVHFFWDSPTCWHHSLILAHRRKTHNCFQVSIPRLSAQLANKVSFLAYLCVFMHDRALRAVFWALTCHNTHIDKMIPQAILMAQFYIWVQMSGHPVQCLSQVFICHHFLIN